MDIEIWDGGLQEQEIEAIKQIKAAFTDSPPDGKSQNRGTSLKDQLQNNLGRNGMFPWKGYAGFRFVDSKGKEGEFDLVIITHCNVIIVELKDWNHEPVTGHGDIWFKGDRNMGRSPVPDYLDCFKSDSSKAGVMDELEYHYGELDRDERNERLQRMGAIGAPNVSFGDDDDDDVDWWEEVKQ